MHNGSKLKLERISLQVQNTSLGLSVMHRDGTEPPVLLLHGFGSTKEDYGDLALHPMFTGRQLIAYDAPGCGQTEIENVKDINIPFLMETAMNVIAHFGVDRFHLVGHSMGGLTALKLANHLGERVISFTNIEGNIAPEDCFLSRQILDYPQSTPEEFLSAFANRVFQSHSVSHPLYSSTLTHKVRAEAVAPIFRSMVAISDNEPLFEQYCSLPCAKMFVYGDENRHLSYLGTLLKRGIQLAEIENSGHFPMYANPPALWLRMAQFINQAEMESVYDP